MVKYIIAKQLVGKRVVTVDGYDLGRFIDAEISERHGKIKVIKLTDKGKKIAEMIDSIYGLISNQKKPEQKQTE